MQCNLQGGHKDYCNRICPILERLISPLHGAFVPGRHITNNIVVAQGIFHSM